jgi:hypothetical protein
MARIPVSRDDLRQTPGFAPASADAFGAETNEALYRAGRAIQQDELAAIELETKRQIDSEQASAAKGLAELEAGYARWEIEARQSAPADGAGYAETAKAEFEKRRDAWLQSITRPEIRNWAEERAAALGGRADVSAFGFQAAARSAKLASDMGAAIDLAANNVYTKPTAEGLRDALLTNISAIDALSATPEVKAQLTTRAKGRLALSYLQGLREQQPYEARDVVKSGALNDLLDADQLSSIGNGIDAEIKAHEQAVRAEQRRIATEAREAARAEKDAARDQIDGLNQLLDAGVPVPAKDIAAVAERAARAGLGAKAYAAQVAGAKNALNVEWDGMPPSRIQARINELDTRARHEGDGVSPGVLIERDHLKKKLSAASTELKNDPLSYATKMGVSVGSLDPQNPATFSARARAASQVKSLYGIPLTVLTDEEAAEAVSEWNSSKGAAREAILDRFLMFGPKGAQAALRQIAPKNSLMAQAGLALTLPGGRAKARDIIAGADILKENPKIAPVQEADEVLRDHVGSALARAPGLSQGLLTASRSLSAARVDRQGITDFRPGAFPVAIDAVLGGGRRRDGTMQGGIVDWRGERTLLPADMSEEEFSAAIRGAKVADYQRAAGGKAPVWANGNPVSDQSLQRMRLRAITSADGGWTGHYIAIDPAGGEVTTADGKPFIFNARALRK